MEKISDNLPPMVLQDEASDSMAAAGSGIRPAISLRKDMKESSAGASPVEATIRKNFPESWIYDDFDDLGLVAL